MAIGKAHFLKPAQIFRNFLIKVENKILISSSPWLKKVWSKIHLEFDAQSVLDASQMLDVRV